MCTQGEIQGTTKNKPGSSEPGSGQQHQLAESQVQVQLCVRVCLPWPMQDPVQKWPALNEPAQWWDLAPGQQHQLAES